MSTAPRTVRATIYLKPAREAPSMARHVLRAAGLAAGLPPECSEALSLCASEVVTNAVIHAGTSMEVDVVIDDTGARVGVHDDKPVDEELTWRAAQHPLQGPADPLSIGGRGLAMIDALATSWGVDRSGPGKTVWFVVGTSPTERP